jgi:hypothetical protein
MDRPLFAPHVVQSSLVNLRSNPVYDFDSYHGKLKLRRPWLPYPPSPLTFSAAEIQEDAVEDAIDTVGQGDIAGVDDIVDANPDGNWDDDAGSDGAEDRVDMEGVEDVPGIDDMTGETVGAVALDCYGNLSAATSTGGRCNKPVGRVGDSCIIGCGTLAEDGNALSGTGIGEAFIKAGACRWVADRQKAGLPLFKSVRELMNTRLTVRALSRPAPRILPRIFLRRVTHGRLAHRPLTEQLLTRPD